MVKSQSKQKSVTVVKPTIEELIITNKAKLDQSVIGDLHSIQDIYRYAVTLYNRNELSYGHTTINAFEDASFLIMHELHLPFQDPISHWSASRLTQAEREHLLNLVHLRASSRIPTPYLVKGCYQQGEYFHIDERALIPRSYLGEIMLSPTINVVGSNNSAKSNGDDGRSASSTGSSSVLSVGGGDTAVSLYRDLDYDDYFGEVGRGEKEREGGGESDTSSTSSSGASGGAVKSVHAGLSVAQQLDALYRKSRPKYLIDTDRVHSVLDLCTGSGCLAILAAKAFPHAERIDAVDISSDALEVASANVDLHGMEEVLTLYHGDLFAPLHEEEGDGDEEDGEGRPSYDLIISNPPYVSAELIKALPTEYTHEPALALAAGRDGLEIVKRILRQAHEHLNDGGGLLCEIGQCREDLERAFPKLFGSVFYDDCHKDSGKNRDEKGGEEEKEEEVKFIHDGSTSRRKVHWIRTAHSTDEVFYVEKKYLTKKYLSK